MDKVKKDAAPGKDGVTVDMMSADLLFNACCALFEVLGVWDGTISEEGESTGSCPEEAI